jgi:hypothetical protein
MILSLLYNNEKELAEEVINRIIEYLHTPFECKVFLIQP